MLDIPIHFIIPVWGKRYISTLFKYTLPSLISPNNFKKLKPSHSHRLTLCVLEKELPLIKKSTYIKEIQKHLSVEFTLIDDIVDRKYHNDSNSFRSQSNYQRMTQAQNRAILKTADKDIAYSFIQADNIFPDGSITNLVQLFRETGKKVYLSYGFYISERKLSSIKKEEGIDFLHLPPMEMAAIAFRSMHSIFKSFMTDSPRYLQSGNFYFAADGFGIVMRQCVLHPILIYPGRKGFSIPSDQTVDNGAYLFKIAGKDETHVIDDSRVFFMYSPGEYSQLKNNLCKINKFNLLDSVGIVSSINSKQRLNLEYACRFFYKNVNKKQFEYYVKDSQKLMDKIFFFTERKLFSDLQKYKNRLITSDDPYQVYIEFCHMLEELLKECHGYFERTSFYVRDKPKCSTRAEMCLILLDYLCEVLSSMELSPSSIFDLPDIQRKINKFRKITSEFNKIGIYGARNDTFDLIHLLGEKELNKIAVIYDDNPLKIGTFVKSVPVSTYKRMDNLEMILINTGRYNNIVYQKVIAEKLPIPVIRL